MLHRTKGQRELKVLLGEKAFVLLESMADRLEVSPSHLIERLLLAASEFSHEYEEHEEKGPALSGFAHRSGPAAAEPLVGRLQVSSGKPRTIFIATTEARLPYIELSGLTGEPGYRVLTKCYDEAEHLPELLQSLRPAALLLDVALCTPEQREILARLRSANPGGRIIMLCGSLQDDVNVDHVFQGVRGCLSYDANADVLLQAIKSVCAGEFWLPRQLTSELILSVLADNHKVDEDISANIKRLPFFLLTERERGVAQLLASGLTNKRIATELALSEDTVKKHVKKIYLKLGLHRRSLVSRLLQ